MRYLLLLLALPVGAANILPNSGYEIGTEGWTQIGNEDQGWPWDHLIQSDVVRSGEYAMSVPWARTNMHRVTGVPMVLEPSTEYTISVYVRESYSHGLNGNMRVENAFAKTNLVEYTILGAEIQVGSWTRHEATFTTEAEQVAYTISASATESGPFDRFLYFDDWQLEKSGAATTYVPKTYELGWGVADDITRNMFWHSDGEAEVPLVVENNTGSEQDVIIDYSVRDFYNEEVITGSISETMADGAITTNTVDLFFDAKGIYRATAWIRDAENTMAETAFSLYTATNTLAAVKDGMFGIHTRGTPPLLSQFRRVGYSRSRSLSTGKRWSGNKEVESSEGVWTFNAADNDELNNFEVYDFPMLLVIGSGRVDDDGWPSWATNNHDVLTSYYTNYVFNVVSNAHGVLGDDHLDLEYPNEPSTETHISVSNYRELMLAADPVIDLVSATLPVGAAAENDSNTTYQILAPGGYTNYVDFITHHAYTGDVAVKPKGISSEFDTYNQWNTESGTVQGWFYQTHHWEHIVGYKSPFIESGTPLPVARPFRVRSLHAVWGITETLNSEITKLFYYDGRSNMGADAPYSYSPMMQDYQVGPMGAVMSTIFSFAEGATNVSQPSVETGLTTSIFDDGSGDVFAISYSARDNKDGLFTLSSSLLDSAITFYNMMGNEIAAGGTDVEVTHQNPVIVHASSTTAASLESSLSAVTVADTTDPIAWIVQAPIGTPSDLTDFEFRWYAGDNVDWMTSTNRDYTLDFRHRLDGGSWSSWHHTNRMYEATIGTSGLFELEARDSAGNIGATSAEWPFPEVAGTVNFTDLTTTILRVE